MDARSAGSSPEGIQPPPSAYARALRSLCAVFFCKHSANEPLKTRRHRASGRSEEEPVLQEKRHGPKPAVMAGNGPCRTFNPMVNRSSSSRLIWLTGHPPGEARGLYSHLGRSSHCYGGSVAASSRSGESPSGGGKGAPEPLEAGNADRQLLEMCELMSRMLPGDRERLIDLARRLAR